MNNHEVDTLWMGDMQFNSIIDGHTVVMDAPEKSGGHDSAPIPKPLLLTALSGCTGMDVIAILRKKGIVLHSFEMKATGELTKTTPKMYHSINLLYIIHGNEADKEAILASILYSQNEICGVSAMLRKAASLSWQVLFNGHIIADSLTNI